LSSFAAIEVSSIVMLSS
jgi:hypothetical protein